MEQTYRKRTGRSQSRSAWDIRRTADLHPADMLLIQHTVENRMPDIIDIIYNLILGIFKCRPALIKIWMDGQIHVTVDRCA